MQQINNFFENYARALEQYNTKGLSFMYNIPCTMLSDDAMSLFNDAGRLEGFFNQGATFYRQFGIAKVRHEVWSRRDITPRIANVKVCWRYMNEKEELLYTCDYLYTMKLDKNDMWKIIQSISINEKERMEAWQAKNA